MDNVKPNDYFVFSSWNDKECVAVVPANVATRCADFVDKDWHEILSVEAVEIRSKFISSAWCKYEKVGMLLVKSISDDPHIPADLECIVMASIASFFTHLNSQ